MLARPQEKKGATLNWKIAASLHASPHAPRLEIDSVSGDFAGNFTVTSSELDLLKREGFQGPGATTAADRILERSFKNSESLHHANMDSSNQYKETRVSSARSIETRTT